MKYILRWHKNRPKNFNSVYIRLCSDFCGEGLRIFALFFSNELGVSIFGLLVFRFVVLSSQIVKTYIKEVSFPPPKPEQKNQFGRPLIPSKPQNDVRVETICSSKMNFAPIDIIPSSCSGDL